MTERSAFAVCPADTHEALKSSLPMFSWGCGGDVEVWADRPEPGLLLVSGQRSCGTTLAMHVTDADWQAFAGEPVPAHVERCAEASP